MDLKEINQARSFAKHLIKTQNPMDLKKHWSNRLAKLQKKNSQNERFGIGCNHSDIRFRLTQLAIKFKL